MKYSNVLKGKRAARRVRFPLVSSGCELLPQPPELAEQYEANIAAWKVEHPGEEPDLSPWLGVVPLTPGEEAERINGARTFAKSRGVEDPKAGEELYEYGRALYTVVLGCVDLDTLENPSGPEPFFDGGVEQILNDPDIGKDTIIYLADQQQAWQEECATQAYQIPPDKLWEAVLMIGGDIDEARRFLGLLQRPTLLSFMRTMASQLLDSWMLKSLSGSEDASITSDSGMSGESTTKKRSRSKAKSASKAKPKRKPVRK